MTKKKHQKDDHEKAAQTYKMLIDERKYSLAYQLFQRERKELILELPVWEIMSNYSLFKTKIGQKEADDFRETVIKTLEYAFDNPFQDEINRRLKD